MKIFQNQWVLFCFVALAICSFGCEPPEFDYSKMMASTEVAAEIAEDVEIYYSDSSKLKVKVSGPISKRYMTGYAIEDEFPEGVYVEFYDEFGNVMSWLTADYAIRKEVDKKIIARNNVVLENVDGNKLEGSELFWDERTREIYSDRFVKITRGDEISYGYFFRSDEGFKKIELKVVEGDMMVDQLKKDF